MEQVGCFKPLSFNQFYFNPIDHQKNDGNGVKYSMICKSGKTEDKIKLFLLRYYLIIPFRKSFNVYFAFQY